MNPLRRRMSAFLVRVVRDGIKKMDPESPCAKELRKIDGEDIVRTEIDRICRAASVTEMTKVIALAEWLKGTSGQEREDIRNDIKEIAEELVARIERESGELRIPRPCRRLLLNL
jgi:hypothetical protein